MRLADFFRLFYDVNAINLPDHIKVDRNFGVGSLAFHSINTPNTLHTPNSEVFLYDNTRLQARSCIFTSMGVFTVDLGGNAELCWWGQPVPEFDSNKPASVIVYVATTQPVTYHYDPQGIISFSTRDSAIFLGCTFNI